MANPTTPEIVVAKSNQMAVCFGTDIFVLSYDPARKAKVSGNAYRALSVKGTAMVFGDQMAPKATAAAPAGLPAPAKQ